MPRERRGIFLGAKLEPSEKLVAAIEVMKHRRRLHIVESRLQSARPKHLPKSSSVQVENKELWSKKEIQVKEQLSNQRGVEGRGQCQCQVVVVVFRGQYQAEGSRD